MSGDKKGGDKGKKKLDNVPMPTRGKAPAPPSGPQPDDGDPDWEDLSRAKRHGKKQGTIYAGLTERLPYIPDKNTKTVTVKSSGKSTSREKPPKLIVGYPKKMLFDMFQMMKPVIKNHPELLKKLLPPEDSHEMRSEASLSDAARLYLVHPVDVAFQAMLKEGKLLCQPEAVENQASRTDFSFYWRDAKKNKHFIAVLELKKRQAIQRDHWKHGWQKGPVTSNASLQQDIEQMITDADEDEQKTNLLNNAIPITQQCKKYSKETRCIAIFDWNHMVFFDFPQQHIEQKTKGVYLADSLTKGIWFTEDKYSLEPKMTFRSMLLGYLIYAVKKQGIPCLKDPSQVPKLSTTFEKGTKVSTHRHVKP